MPVYTYRCPTCGSTHDEKRRVEVRNVDAYCETCDQYSAKRVLLAPNVNMNGGGSQQSDSITQWQFNNLDDKRKSKLPRLSPDAIL